jgi:hypothetical protein
MIDLTEHELAAAAKHRFEADEKSLSLDLLTSP